MASEEADFKNVPLPTGPYRVGTATFDIEPPQGRVIPIQIYFPMEKGSHQLHSKIIEERAPGPWEPLKVKVYSEKADLSALAGSRHPLILLNHANLAPMTEYAFLAEDLSSHGYVVVSIQHQLKSDWEEDSTTRNAQVVKNVLFVFEWLKECPFKDKIDLKRVGLIGHSMGANALLLLNSAHQTELLPREDQTGVKECLILMETTRFPDSLESHCSLFFLMAETRESNEEIKRLGHQVRYYKGATHLSFMDHGYINPPKNLYFNGTAEEQKAFFDEVRKDIRIFTQRELIN